MPYCWKTEYYCIDKDDDAVNWLGTLEEAEAYAESHDDIVRIDKVKHYQDDTETVWEKDDD